ncbi:MAG TPA: EF-P lysine aminoacylase EpmA [Xanthomonadaceae bacterium]|nr:EF-P lysine aminoacylase EpmA [Xanthomonadaceae bacterium]
MSTEIRDSLAFRARLNHLVRGFFAARGVLEVETPVLSAAAATDVHIDSFRADFTGPGRGGATQRFLRTSPEFFHKRLLAAGVGDLFELARVFRNGEAGRRHNPEFTLLEWYRVGIDHHALMDEVEALIVECLRLVDKRVHVRRLSYRDWFLQGLGLDPFEANIEALREPLLDRGIDTGGLSRDDWLDLAITHILQPALPADGLLFVYDYPASQCALARLLPGAPPRAARFEAFLGRQELANGYWELTDAVEQRTRFEADNRRRAARGSQAMPIDEHLLDALMRGLPDCAGVALGVDRLLMYLLDATDIAEVLAFPFDRA